MSSQITLLLSGRHSNFIDLLLFNLKMSIFQKELVQQIADSLQIQVKDEICSILIQDVEYRLREIIHVRFVDLGIKYSSGIS
jgi:hypothetical protein